MSVTTLYTGCSGIRTYKVSVLPQVIVPFSCTLKVGRQGHYNENQCRKIWGCSISLCSLYYNLNWSIVNLLFSFMFSSCVTVVLMRGIFEPNRYNIVSTLAVLPLIIGEPKVVLRSRGSIS